MRTKLYQKVSVLVCVLGIIFLISMTVGVSYGWYLPCHENLHNVTCIVTNCTVIFDNHMIVGGRTVWHSSHGYRLNITYKYIPFRITKFYTEMNPEANAYCRQHHANSTVPCYYDSRYPSTLSYDFDCYYKEYQWIMIIVGIIVTIIIAISSAGIVHPMVRN